MNIQSNQRTHGQALVEFALASTIIFFLLAAAVDLGLIFLNLQGMRVAVQEGATYGSYVQNGQVNITEIRNRTRFSSGTSPSPFTNLLDLNNDGVDDSGQASVLTNYIQVETFMDTTPDDGVGNNAVACTDITAKVNCFVQVTLHYDYRVFFPLTPAFADTVPLQAEFTMPLR